MSIRWDDVHLKHTHTHRERERERESGTKKEYTSKDEFWCVCV